MRERRRQRQPESSRVYRPRHRAHQSTIFFRNRLRREGPDFPTAHLERGRLENAYALDKNAAEGPDPDGDQA
jgi:hypothetical protein